MSISVYIRVYVCVRCDCVRVYTVSIKACTEGKLIFIKFGRATLLPCAGAKLIKLEATARPKPFKRLVTEC